MLVSRRDFLHTILVAGALLVLPDIAVPSPSSEITKKTLNELLAEVSKVFGRLTKWRLRCQEQNAVTEADLIRLAEQVLAEPCTGTVAEGQSYWIRLNRLRDEEGPEE